ncbi:heat shock factor isoform X2 [Rhynchophorus ferrugineus]|uniref:heat shock factor isoform X2 n=1 Tax=Rhynchophorus ferrugineus TaxID=354439 RepID=UPI003FCD9E06
MSKHKKDKLYGADDNDETGETASTSGNVPLFIKKLWKMVNDDNAEDIISWNNNGDGFVIHDQLNFVSKTLPKYFKHNHLSSFVRQLNLYDFHKIQNVDKDEFQFSHPFFMRDVPQLLPLIKRKSTGRPKVASQPAENSELQIQEIMTVVEDIKNKNDKISNEMSQLRQENAALWGEMNSLRVKYSKQTKIINKLIHFLITYMQKHHNSRKSGRTVSSENSNKYLKTGPKIMELDYKYKNNPHEFWNDFDSKNSPSSEHQNYTVVEPSEDQMEIGEQPQRSSTPSSSMSVSSAIEELLSNGSPFCQPSEGSMEQLPTIDFNVNSPSSSKASKSALQRTNSNKDNLGYFIDNSQVELSTIKEMLKNMSPDDMASLCKLMNENYKGQDEATTSEPNLDINDEMTEKDLLALTEMTPSSEATLQQDDLDIPMELVDELPNFDKDPSGLNTPQIKLNLNSSPLDHALQASQLNKALNMPSLSSGSNIASTGSTCNTDTDLDATELSSQLNTPQLEAALDTDDILNNISVDQYFNMD